jgi:hypothetical protein
MNCIHEKTIEIRFGNKSSQREIVGISFDFVKPPNSPLVSLTSAISYYMTPTLDRLSILT